MRKFVSSAVAVTMFGFTSIASAADMPVKATPMVAAPFNWSGLYFGATVGWNNQNNHWAFDPPVSGGVRQEFDESKGTSVVGGYVGYQQQFGAWVLGIEGALTTPLQERWASSLCPNAALNCETRNGDLYTVGPRFGYAMDKWLFFVNGGYAVQKIDGRAINPVTGVAQEPTNVTQHGWYLGGGVDMALTKEFFVGIEYQHVDVGSGFHCPLSCGIVSNENYDVTARDDIVRARFTWRPGVPFGPN